MAKPVFDLTLADIEEFPVWFFPMDESVEDETFVTPLESLDNRNFHALVIVRTEFTDSNGSRYLGYIYWDGIGVVNQCQPSLFIGPDEYLTFWSGSKKPSWATEGILQQTMRGKFPISFKSQNHFGFSSIEGDLRGLYFFDENYQIQYI